MPNDKDLLDCGGWMALKLRMYKYLRIENCL